MNASVNPSQRKSRIWYLDLLRIAASFAVIGLHIYSQDAQMYDVNSPHTHLLILLTSLLRWCVPVFLMISGALFLSNERKLSISQLYHKTIARLVISFFSWSALYALIHCLRTNKGVWTFANQLLRGHYHMWYLFLILGLYLLTPVIRKITESRKTTEYLLMLCFAFTFLFSRVFTFLRMFDLPHSDVIISLHAAFAQTNPLPGMYALFYYVLGHYLHTYHPQTTLRYIAYAAGIVGYLLTAALTLWHSNILGSTSDHFTDASSLTVLAISVAIFLFFKQAFASFSPGNKRCRLLMQLSACSYGIYLVHPAFIEAFYPVIPSAPLLLLLSLPLWMLAVYALSFIVSAVLFRIPFVNRYII